MHIIIKYMMTNAFASAIFQLSTLTSFAQQPHIKLERVAPGVIKMSTGKPDIFSPYQYCDEKPRVEEMKNLSDKGLPFDIKDVKIFKNSRGIQTSLPLSEDEQLYGFGLQTGSFGQRGLIKNLL